VGGSAAQVSGLNEVLVVHAEEMAARACARGHKVN
jgi:hypothetical protein